MREVLTKENFEFLNGKPVFTLNSKKNRFEILNSLQILYGDNVSDDMFIDQDHPLANGLIGTWIEGVK